MCQLPRTQPNSVALTEQMIYGFTEYPDTFPSADIEKLQNMLEKFNSAKKEFNDCLSLYRQAGDKQKQAFEDLNVVIANQVKSAQVDTADNPEKLGLIGFGERKENIRQSARPAGTSKGRIHSRRRSKAAMAKAINKRQRPC